MDTSNQRVTNQHTIPNVFLKKFCPKDKEGNIRHNRLQQFHKNKEIFSERTTDKIMVKKHFYTMIFEERNTWTKKQSFFLENFFNTNFELHWNKYFQKIYTQQISDEDWVNICSFIAQLFSRSLYFRNLYMKKVNIWFFIDDLPPAK